MRATRLRLAVGLALLLCCGAPPPPPSGQLNGPAGLALSGDLLLVANQNADELHAYLTQSREFVASPNVLFPLSIPTVRRPGFLCANSREVFAASSVDPLVGVIDDVEDQSSNDPVSGLRELGQLPIPGVAQALVCAPAPEAVVAHETAVSGSPAAYEQAIASGALTLDGPNGQAPGGGPDERHAFAALPTAAIAAISRTGSSTELFEVENDITGANCPDAGFIESCAPGADASVCPGPSAFCPSSRPLFVLPPQPDSCAPLGPPIAQGFDVASSGPGTTELGGTSADPTFANLLLAADRNSNCVAAVDLGSSSAVWIPAGGPTRAIAALPYLPGQCVPGGALFAAALDSESCEQMGPPPPGGYVTCDGVTFFQPSVAFHDPNPLHARIPAPLPYPFVASPDRPMPPVRLAGTVVTSIAFTGPGMRIGGFSTALGSTIPIQFALLAGTADGAFVYIDVGIGQPNGGTGPLDGGAYACPPAYFAPRILDVNDYLPSPPLPSVGKPSASDPSGTALPPPVATADLPLTQDGGSLPEADRLGAPFAPAGSSPVTCWALAQGTEVCATTSFVEHGVAEDETLSIAYQGTIGTLSSQPETITGATLQSQAGVDLTSYLPEAGGADGGVGVLVSETPALGVDVVTSGGKACGDYGVAAVAPQSLSLVALPGGAPLSCAQGSGTFTIFAAGDKPYVVSGSESGFVGLWPADGTLHLVQTGRWQYPADLIGMAHSAEELTDLVFGPVPSSPAPGSTLAPPRPEDYRSLESAFGLALLGKLGTPLPAAEDGGTALAPGVSPVRGASYTLQVASGVSPLNVNPADPSSLIESMASYLDAEKARHVYATYWGGSALIELNPESATYNALNETH